MYFYIIMPIGVDSKSSEKKCSINKIAESENISAHFPDYLQKEPAFNLSVLLNDIRGAGFVLADLSFERPSCYYEVGLAEALGKKIYLIAKTGIDIHQTAERKNVRFFKNLKEFECVIRQIIVKEKQHQTHHLN